MVVMTCHFSCFLQMLDNVTHPFGELLRRPRLCQESTLIDGCKVTPVMVGTTLIAWHLKQSGKLRISLYRDTAFSKLRFT